MSERLFSSGKVLMENCALGLLRSNQVRCFLAYAKCFIWQIPANSDLKLTHFYPTSPSRARRHTEKVRQVSVAAA